MSLIDTISQDLKIEWDNDLFVGDLSISSDGDLSYDQGLATAILISLFTDRKASEEDILPDILSIDRRGWWGDLVLPEVEGDQIGSKLWLLERSKTTPEVVVLAKEYVEEACQWIIDDNIASDIEINVEKQIPSNRDPGNARLAIQVRVTLIDGTIIKTGVLLELTTTHIQPSLFFERLLDESGDIILDESGEAIWGEGS